MIPLLTLSSYPCIISGQAIKVWFTSQRTMYGKLHNKKKLGTINEKKMTYRQRWVMDKLSFLRSHLVTRTKTKSLGSGPSQSQPQPQETEEDDELPDLDITPVEVPLTTPSSTPPAAATVTKTFKPKKKKEKPVSDYIKVIAERMSDTSALRDKVNIFINYVISLKLNHILM